MSGHPSIVDRMLLFCLTQVHKSWFKIESIIAQVSSWARLGQVEPCSKHRSAHEFEVKTRTQAACSQCDFRLTSVDEVLDAECVDVDLLFTASPRQQRDAMDDSFLEDLDNPRNRRLKRQWECLATNFQPKEMTGRARFQETIRQPMHVLFPKKPLPTNPPGDSPGVGQPSSVHPPASSRVESMPSLISNDDVLVSVVIEADERRPLTHPSAVSLARTVFLLSPHAKISDVIEAVATKMRMSSRDVVAEFSARDYSGGFLGLDDEVVQTVVLRSRTLSD